MPAPSRPPVYPELAAELARRGITHSALSQRIGVSSNYIGQIIRGHAPLSANLRDLIAAELDVDAAQLFGVPA